MLVRRGEGTKLSLMLLRNGAPWTGRSLSVRVVGADGVEFTSSVAAPETAEPGLYSVDWSAPALVGKYVALWVSGFRTWAEEIEVVNLGGGSAGTETIVGIVQGDEIDPLVGVVGRDEQLDAVIGRDEQLTTVIDDGHNVKGVVGRDEQVTGVLEENP